MQCPLGRLNSGVGPAVRTGNPCSKYWPGGTRSSSPSGILLRPPNARETNPLMRGPYALAPSDATEMSPASGSQRLGRIPDRCPRARAAEPHDHLTRQGRSPRRNHVWTSLSGRTKPSAGSPTRTWVAKGAARRLATLAETISLRINRARRSVAGPAVPQLNARPQVTGSTLSPTRHRPGQADSSRPTQHDSWSRRLRPRATMASHRWSARAHRRTAVANVQVKTSSTVSPVVSAALTWSRAWAGMSQDHSPPDCQRGSAQPRP